MSTAWQQQISGSPYPRDTGFFFGRRIDRRQCTLPQYNPLLAQRPQGQAESVLRARFQCGRSVSFAQYVVMRTL